VRDGTGVRGGVPLAEWLAPLVPLALFQFASLPWAGRAAERPPKRPGGLG
jgi:hypothetical protein